MSVAITAAVQGILSTSYVWWQNTETVTLTVAGTSPEQSHTVTNSKRFDVSDRDLPAQKQGGLVAFDLVWLLPVATLGGVVPKVADIVTPSSGIEYTIQDLNQNGWRTWFKVMGKSTMKAAPMKLPRMDPMPPMMIMNSRLSEKLTENAAGSQDPRCTNPHIAPATPA
jgi:hypothetical protein